MSIQFKLNAHGVSLVVGMWVVWGWVCMGLAHTSIADWSWFADFRDAMKVIPSVGQVPSAEAIDPVVSSSFLALIWATSPIVWLLFRRLPADRLMPTKAWNAPLAASTKWEIFIIAACAVATPWIDFGSRSFVNQLMTHDVFRFSIIASLVTGLPWYAVCVVNNWAERAKKLSVNP